MEKFGENLISVLSFSRTVHASGRKFGTHVIVAFCVRMSLCNLFRIVDDARGNVIGADKYYIENIVQPISNKETVNLRVNWSTCDAE